MLIIVLKSTLNIRLAGVLLRAYVILAIADAVVKMYKYLVTISFIILYNFI